MTQDELQDSFCSMAELTDGYLEIYNGEGYNQGLYCHEASFRWGFQEGVQWAERRLLEKCRTLDNQNNA